MKGLYEACLEVKPHPSVGRTLPIRRHHPRRFPGDLLSLMRLTEIDGGIAVQLRCFFRTISGPPWKRTLHVKVKSKKSFPEVRLLEEAIRVTNFKRSPLETPFSNNELSDRPLLSHFFGKWEKSNRSRIDGSQSARTGCGRTNSFESSEPCNETCDKNYGDNQHLEECW